MEVNAFNLSNTEELCIHKEVMLKFCYKRHSLCGRYPRYTIFRLL